MVARGILVLGLAALLTGCSAFSGKKEEPAPTPPPTADNRMDLLEERLKQHEREIEELKGQMARVNERIARAGGREAAPATWQKTLPTPSVDPGANGAGNPAAPPSRTPPTPAAGDPPAAPRPPAANIPSVPHISDPATQEKVSTLMQKLQSDPGTATTLASEFRPYGRYVAPTLIAWLKEFSLRRAAEQVLSGLDPKDAQPIVVEALKRETDAQSQVPLVRILGRLGDNAAVPPLRDYLKSENKDLRFYAADALVRLRTKDGIPTLIEFLKSGEDAKCVIAFETLHAATTYTFGYKFWGKPEEKEEAAKRWEEWWAQSGAAFQFK